MSTSRILTGSTITLGAAALMILLTIMDVEATRQEDMVDEKAPEVVGVAWLNSAPLKIGDLRGKVVLVDFWEYTCINCLRTLPYVTEWNRRYADKGLIIIGVHTPEFEFGKEVNNVKDAVKRFNIEYPVALDNEYQTWSNYENRYWPRKYLVDKEGIIRYDHIGEGAYGEIENKIQELLREIHPAEQLPAIMEPVRGADKPGAVCYPVTPELYCGYLRGRLGNPAGYSAETIIDYEDPVEHVDGSIYLNGRWYNSGEFVRHGEQTESLNDYIGIKYHALEVNAVIKQSGRDAFKVYITQDGRNVAPEDRGDDVQVEADGRTFLLINEPRMYNIIRNKIFGSHELQLASMSGEFEIYAYTFGSCEIP